MCLIAFALNAHPDWPLVVLANRDEFHERPALQSQWWTAEDGTDIFGGRDLQAGGTWMACSRQGRLAALTNIRQVPAVNGARSRGHLVMDALSVDDPHQLDLSQWASFNLLTFDPLQTAAGVAWQAGYANSAGARHSVSDGLHALSNATLNAPWPKAQRLQAALDDLLRQPHRDWLEQAFSALGDRSVWPDDVLPSTGVPLEWERMLSACHIVSPAYGTRCSTVVRVDREGRLDWHERSFAPSGDVISEVQARNCLTVVPRQR